MCPDMHHDKNGRHIIFRQSRDYLLQSLMTAGRRADNDNMRPLSHEYFLVKEAILSFAIGGFRWPHRILPVKSAYFLPRNSLLMICE
jgi:hypothetical protein